MKKMFQIAMLKIKLTFKDRGALVWMFLAPLIFVVVLVVGFGGGSNGGGNNDVKYPIGIVNNDTGHYSTELLNLIKSDKTFEVREFDYEKAKGKVEEGSTALALVIPDGYSKILEDGTPGQIELLKLQDNETTIAISAIIGNYVNQQRFGINTGNAAVTVLSTVGAIKSDEGVKIKTDVEASFIEDVKSPKIGYTTKKVVHEEKPGLDGMSYAAIGIFIMFIMYFVSGGAGSILEEKELGTWSRISSSPTRNFSIVGGYTLGTFLLGWIQVAVLILVSRYVFHINWGNSTLGLVMLFSSYLLAIIGLGSALAAFVKTKAQLSTLTAIVVMPTSLLAGCMWPREFMPDIMLKISNFVPQTWIIKGMTDLVARGSDISAAYAPSLILLIFASLFFITGVNFMKLQKR